MQWLFSAVLYVQFEVSKSILVISVYSRLFFREPRLNVTLKTNKTTSVVLIFFRRLWRNRPNILSWQTAVSEVIDRPACQRYYLPMDQNVSPPICLFAFLSVLFAPCLCERGHFMEVSGERKYFYLAINGSMEMCLLV